MMENESSTKPLWRTLIRQNDMGISPEGMAQIMKAVADSIPCLRLSGGIDFTSAGDVRRWLYDESARALKGE